MDHVWRNSMVAWLPTMQWDWFVTLIVNRDTSANSLRNDAKRFFNALDRSYLNRNSHKHPSTERTEAFVAIEGGETNLHMHALVRMPPKAMSEPRDQFKLCMQRAWLKTESRRFDCKSIYDVSGVVNYVTKELGDLERCESWFFASEFHRGDHSDPTPPAPPRGPRQYRVWRAN